MEKSEVSIHEARFYVELTKELQAWLTARQLSEKARVAERTSRAYCQKLVRLGILDQIEVFPSHRYKLSDKARKRNVAYIQRLEQACEVFGLTSPSA